MTTPKSSPSTPSLKPGTGATGLIELRVKVAELCGHKCLGAAENWRWPSVAEREDGTPYGIPDYPNDLNACHEFEKSLHNAENGEKWNVYRRRLRHICAYEKCDPVHATAEQRCRAFIATMESSSVQGGNEK